MNKGDIFILIEEKFPKFKVNYQLTIQDLCNQARFNKNNNGRLYEFDSFDGDYIVCFYIHDNNKIRKTEYIYINSIIEKI